MDGNGRAIKIAIMGGGGVGKSSITVKYVQNIFVEVYDPTIEDSYRKQVLVDGMPYVAEILDTAGTEQFSAMRDLYIKNSEGYLLVFSVLSRSTINDMEEIYEQIKRINPDCPIVICANKVDLEEQRIITTEECAQISTKYQSILVETSPKTDLGVMEAFDTLFKAVIENRRKVVVPKKRRKCTIL